ncbi:unnamed protein product [Brassicogethes aeneus]|uniref:Uncharacterized protein n=1 Tax=Brassicogethes aeneus TaxID=1431903 RepID=A0A9P0ATS2_BRAAE|nr:unnamed protein product [Brassicogethes aeneus]
MPFSPVKLSVFKTEQIIGVKEPKRTTLYDVVLNNFKALKRETFIHRLIYIGEHCFKEPDELASLYEKIIYEINTSNLVDERQTGFLLFYPKFFVIIIDGSGNSICKHLKDIAKYRENLPKLKVLVFIHNVNQRVCDTFYTFTSLPSQLVDKIDHMSDLQTTMTLTANCIKKMYELVTAFLKNLEDIELQKEQELKNQMLEMSMEQITKDLRGSKSSSILVVQFGMFREFLPEYDLLDFLLNTKHLMDYGSFQYMWDKPVPFSIHTHGIFPVPYPVDTIDIFEIPYNPVCKLPVSKEEEIKDEEEVASVITQSSI